VDTTKAAITLQSHWSGFVDRKNAEENRAAVVLQKNWRRFVNRNMYRQHKASLIVQSLWRGWTVRKVCEEQNAAATIQAWFKGVDQRRLLVRIGMRLKPKEADLGLDFNAKPKIKTCFRCFEHGHRKEDCPHLNEVQCNTCREFGHRNWECERNAGKKTAGQRKSPQKHTAKVEKSHGESFQRTKRRGDDENTENQRRDDRHNERDDREESKENRCFKCLRNGHSASHCRQPYRLGIRESGTCYCCGSSDHKKVNCPRRGEGCDKCQSFEHVTSVCSVGMCHSCGQDNNAHKANCIKMNKQ